jgi:hypothetical protein
MLSILSASDDEDDDDDDDDEDDDGDDDDDDDNDDDDDDDSPAICRIASSHTFSSLVSTPASYALISTSPNAVYATFGRTLLQLNRKRPG